MSVMSRSSIPARLSRLHRAEVRTVASTLPVRFALEFLGVEEFRDGGEPADIREHVGHVPVLAAELELLRLVNPWLIAGPWAHRRAERI